MLKIKNMATKNSKQNKTEINLPTDPNDLQKKIQLIFSSLKEYLKGRRKEIFYTPLIILLALLITFWISMKNSTPDSSLLYKIKRGQEKLFLDRDSNPSSRVKYQKELLDNRYKELKYLGENNLEQYIDTASSRYSTTLSELSELIITNNLDDQRKELMVKLGEHKRNIRKVHDGLFLKYGVTETLSQRWHLQAAMDSSDIFIEKLQTPVK